MAQAQDTAEKHEKTAASGGSNGSAISATIKVRVKHGRLLIGRQPAEYDARGTMTKESSDERYAEQGEVVEVSRVWAERLLKREFDGYPSTTNNGAPGVVPGVIRDCPIEIVH